jgi:hypothetical protein
VAYTGLQTLARGTPIIEPREAFGLRGIPALFRDRSTLFLYMLDRFNALNTAFTDASSIFVSTPEPHLVWPFPCLIWM